MDNMKSLSNGTLEAEKEKTEYKMPKQARVWLLNDDYTTMEFVVFILKSIFHHDEVKAEMIMQQIHKMGKGIAGTYVADIADTKVAQVHRFARSEGFPLRCMIEYI